jgi:hypothetical protein
MTALVRSHTRVATPLDLQVTMLAASIPQLSPRDRNFASSLCDQYNRHGRLSAAQEPWIARLLERALAPNEPGENVGSLGGIVELLERARQHLRYPAILLRANQIDLRLSIAGPRARVPGSVNVTSTDRRDSDGQRDFYGRVTSGGVFEPNNRYDRETQTAIAAAIRVMATSPAEAAAEYGHLTGVCCFCGRRLTDERSTAVGYGPICAGHYGLPWGDCWGDC